MRAPHPMLQAADDCVATHARLAAAAAQAVGGTLLPATGLAALALDSQPLPHLGCRSTGIQLLAGVDADEAAAAAAGVLQQLHILHLAAPAADGPAVTLTTPQCPPADFAVAAAAAPQHARHGWSAASGGRLRESAALRHLAQPHAFVLVPHGQALTDLQLPAGSPAAAALIGSQAWDDVGARLRALPAPCRDQLAPMPGLLLVADTVAAVGADVALLPLSDPCGPTRGVASMALCAAHTACAAAAGSPAALQELSSVTAPAEAWQWVQRHGTRCASDETAQQQLSGWRPAERAKLLTLLRSAGAIQLDAGCAAPRVALGWGSLSFLQPPTRGCTPMLAAAMAKRTALPTLNLQELADGLQVAGLQLAGGPLEVRQTVASRSGSQLIWVSGLDASNDEAQQALQLAVVAAAGRPCLVVPLDTWIRCAGGARWPSHGGPPAGCASWGCTSLDGSPRSASQQRGGAPGGGQRSARRRLEPPRSSGAASACGAVGQPGRQQRRGGGAGRAGPGGAGAQPGQQCRPGAVQLPAGGAPAERRQPGGPPGPGRGSRAPRRQLHTRQQCR